jgi:hypothetical protein
LLKHSHSPFDYGWGAPLQLYNGSHELPVPCSARPKEPVRASSGSAGRLFQGKNAPSLPQDLGFPSLLDREAPPPVPSGNE